MSRLSLVSHVMWWQILQQRSQVAGCISYYLDQVYGLFYTARYFCAWQMSE